MTTWMRIADPDQSKEAWTGTVAPPAKPGDCWTFELARQRKSVAGFYDQTPFEWDQPVVGLINFERDCTLVRPRVLQVKAGSLGIKTRGTPTIISGEFDGLLHDLAIPDLEVPTIAGLVFECEALGVWLGHDTINTDRSTEGVVSISTNRLEEERAYLPGGGELVVKSQVGDTGSRRSVSYRPRTFVQIKFPNLSSLNDVMALFIDLHRLFGFLIGHQSRLPPLRIWTADSYKVGEREIPKDGELELSGYEWRERSLPYRHECLSLRQEDLTLSSVLGRFFAAREDLAARIHAADFARLRSTNLNDRFSIVMPILERYLQARYANEEETSFLAHRSTFFAWIDSAEDPNIQKFCNKHIRVVDQKSPALRNLLDRAIQHINSRGFRTPGEMAKRIQQRRASLFHAAFDRPINDGAAFVAEEGVATALLLLHTLEDLGADVTRLVADPHPIRDLARFLVPSGDQVGPEPH